MTAGSLQTEQFARSLWNARTTADVEAILAEVAKAGSLTWRALGDRTNNNGTIRMASDPNLAFVERVTNGMDAILDLAHLQHPGVDVASPREAARQWLHVPEEGIGGMIAKERRELAERLQVTFRSSGEAARPTIVVQDAGTGQTRDAVPQTLCSLNENNKIKQQWTMGTYGQGGSVTFGFSEATIILTRRHPDHLDGAEDVVSWTVVQGHQYDDAFMPTYEYLVGSDKLVFAMPASLFPDLPHGTRITHVTYDWRGGSQPFTTNPWQFFNGALFDPCIPFLLAGDRTKTESGYGDRVITGNAARLQRPDEATARGDIEIPHADILRVDLEPENGSVLINYWVVRRPAGSSSTTDAAASYVRADNAVCMTLFGQRQDVEPRSWIKERIKLPFLYKNLIVQISCDGLTARGKNNVFASTRERATRGDLHSLIFGAVIEAMHEDPELRRLEHEMRERLLARSTSAASDKIRKRLRDFIKTKLKGMTKPGRAGATGEESGKAPRPRPPRPRPQPKDTDDSALPKVPTRIRFQNESLRVHQGATTHVTVEINAKNGYLPDHDEHLDVQITGPGEDRVHCRMRSRLMGGESRWYFEADGDAPLGENKIMVSLLTTNGIIAADATIEVKSPPPAKPEVPGVEDETGPNVRWVRTEEAAGLGWDRDEVGEVKATDELTDILIYRDTKVLVGALSGRNLTEDAVNARAERYLFPVACALWLQYDAVQKAENRPSDAYLKAERLRVAEAVLLAANPDVDIAQTSGDS